MPGRKTFGRRRGGYRIRKSYKLSGQPFPLKRPVKSDSIKGKIVNCISLNADINGDVRFTCGPDGYYNNDTSLTRYDDDRFYKYGR